MRGRARHDSAEPDLRSIKAAAKAQFGKVPGVEGFGLGDRCLRTYVRNEQVKTEIPSSFQGVDVEIVITGDVTAQR